MVPRLPLSLPLLHFCRLLTFMACWTTTNSIDSINMQLKDLDKIDLSVLGASNLDRHSGSWDLTVDENCVYKIELDFKHDNSYPIGDNNFEGVCDPTSTSNAPDGKGWHAQRRSWTQFPEYFEEATGFNHVSIDFKPCGLPPLGLRQPRYDINLYTITPHYRASMICDEFNTPAVCDWNQTTVTGRGMFSLPVLWKDQSFIANMPADFKPDLLQPEAYQHEGLVSFDIGLIPPTVRNWRLPLFIMNSYDGDVVAWKGLLPYDFVSGNNNTEFFGTQFYVYQTMNSLPSAWNMTYTARSGQINVLVVGASGLCGADFETAKAEYLASLE